MSIQKKSLLSSLNTTKKAIVASSANEETPKVSQPVTGRKSTGNFGRKAGLNVGRVELRKAGAMRNRVRGLN